MIYHVAKNGSDRACGTAEAPFLTIGCAAKMAGPGDTIRVHEGVYREEIHPMAGGAGEHARIVYEAAEGEHVVIKGSEVITDWEKVGDDVWKTVIPNAFFGEFNPYDEPLRGDWFREPADYPVHSGDVYLNGRSLYEASSMDDLIKAPRREFGVHRTAIPHPEDTGYRWYSEVGEDVTTIWCHLHGEDPRKECMEINVRRCCIRPLSHGMNYITIRGFEIAQAATPWNPPSSGQVGMVNPNFAKGWIIENCDLHDAKTSAVCLGTEESTGHNLSSRFGRKSSHLLQMEAVFLALSHGWSKDTVGSHIVRNNVIHDCGENGIVGHLGCIFSRIEHNHIYNIGIKYEFGGDEIAGIKFHTPIDTVITGNNIHDCSLGMWLDWQSQGIRVTKNLLFGNIRDLEIEVGHGPATIDNNLFLSDYNIDNYSQGTAFVHNLVYGQVYCSKDTFRNTPYHLPHSTSVLAICPIWGGDDRVMNNLVFGTFEDRPNPAVPSRILRNFGSVYDDYSTPEEYPKRLAEDKEPTFSITKYALTPQPVYIDGNAYAGHARPFRGEKDYVQADRMEASVSEENGVWILTLRVPEAVAGKAFEPVTAGMLGAPRIAEAPYENADGTPIDFIRDYLGNERGEAVCPGPFAHLDAGEMRIPVWKK